MARTSSGPTGTVPSGWYPDPWSRTSSAAGPGRFPGSGLRWWDGEGWTSQVLRGQPVTAPAPPDRWWILPVVVMVGFALTGAACIGALVATDDFLRRTEPDVEAEAQRVLDTLEESGIPCDEPTVTPGEAYVGPPAQAYVDCPLADTELALFVTVHTAYPRAAEDARAAAPGECPVLLTGTSVVTVLARRDGVTTAPAPDQTEFWITAARGALGGQVVPCR